MFKFITFSVSLILIGFVLFKFILNRETTTLLISEGLWVEIADENKQYELSEYPILIEKLPAKDLIFFSLSGKNQPSKIFQLSRDVNKKLKALNLSPIFECNLTSEIDSDTLVAYMTCDGQSKKIIRLKNTGLSLFNPLTEEKSVTNKHTETLPLISKIESLNKEIHFIKKNTKNLIEGRNINATSVESSSEIGQYEKFLEDPELLNKKLNIQNEQLNNLEKDRKDLVRVSNYGYDINLASRLNKIEWNILSKKWNSNIQTEHFPVSTGMGETIAKNPVNSPIPNPTAMENSNSDLDIPNEINKNSWWKEF